MEQQKPKLSILWHSVSPFCACYDEETEVLTLNGWKKIKDIEVSEKVATLNPETQELEFQKANKKFIYDYNGLMYRIKSKFVDLLVTPNHKMYIAKRQRDGSWKFRLEEAQKIYAKAVKYLKAAKWKGVQPEYFVLPPVEVKKTEGRQNPPYTYKAFREPRQIRTEDWVRFLGYWLSEGYIDHNPNYSRGKYETGNYTIGIRQKNPELLKKMGKALERVTIGKVYYYEDKVIVRDKQLWNYLKRFGYCPEKFIPEEIKNLTSELLQIFLEAYWEGDGQKDFHRIFTSSSRMKDDLQEIIIKAGFASDFVERKLGITYIRGRKIVPKHNIYVLSFNSWNTKPLVNKTSRQDSFVKYSGKVYCVEVPNHILLVRRNGKTVFSGNSGYGKVTRYVTNLLSQNGYRVVISAYYGVEPGQQIVLNPNLIMVGSKIGQFGIQSSRMYADMYRTDVSLLHTDFWAFPDFPRLHPRAILHSPQDSEEYDPATYEATKLYFSVTTLTEWSKRDFEKHGIKVDEVIHHGVDTSIFKPLDKKECRKHFGYPEDKFIFGMVSANNDKEDRKNWSGTLRAFRHLLDQDPDIGRECRLVLFTDPVNPAGYPIASIAHKLGLDQYVFLFPSQLFNVGIPDTELNMLYNCFDVHVLCSKREGFGLCVDKDTLIETSQGVKPIKEVEVGDRVLAKEGDFKSVLGRKKRLTSGVQIKVQGLPSIITSKEHQFLVSKNSRGAKVKNLEWLKASDLEKGDFLFVPRPKLDKSLPVKVDLKDYVPWKANSDSVWSSHSFSNEPGYYSLMKHLGYSKRTAETVLKYLKNPEFRPKRERLKQIVEIARSSGIEIPKNKKYPRFQPLNEDFLSIIGWYLAEGSVSSALELSLGIKDREWFKQINCLKNLGTVKEEFEGRKWRILLCGPWKEFFKQFGTSANAKKIPEWLYLSGSFLQPLVRSLLLGDGCSIDGMIQLCTASRTLAYQYRQILLSWGYYPSIRNDPRTGVYLVTVCGAQAELLAKFLKLEGWFKPKKAKTKRKGNSAIGKDTFILVPIREIKEHPETEMFDIQVEDSQTFVGGGILLHNTILESMCSGIPNIVHNYSSMTELVRGRGWLVKSLTSGINRIITPINSEFHIPDTYDLYEKMKRSYLRPQEREKYSLLSRKYALQHDWNIIFREKWLPYLEEIRNKLPNEMVGDTETKRSMWRKLSENL
jgi:glycosyltransferase involved in cell wall biosynthesis